MYVYVLKLDWKEYNEPYARTHVGGVFDVQQVASDTGKRWFDDCAEYQNQKPEKYRASFSYSVVRLLVNEVTF